MGEVKLKPYPMIEYKLNDPEIKFEDSILSIKHKMLAECIDMKESAILDAVARAAKEAGVTELLLMDRQFVLDTLVGSLERWRANEAEKDKFE